MTSGLVCLAQAKLCLILFAQIPYFILITIKRHDHNYIICPTACSLRLLRPRQHHNSRNDNNNNNNNNTNTTTTTTTITTTTTTNNNTTTNDNTTNTNIK